MIAAHTIHLPNSRSKQSSIRTRQTCASKEEGVSLLRFRTLVPHSNEVEGPQEHASLSETEEEACS